MPEQLISIFILAGLAILFFLVVDIFLKKNKTQTEEVKLQDYPYTAKWNFMTPSELKFFKMLEQVVEDKYYIVPQVNLSNLLYLAKWQQNYNSYRSKIDKKSIDFVLFTKDEYKFHLAVELDDPTHEREDRIQRDEFVNEAMKKAGLRLIRCKLMNGYDKEYIELLKINLGLI